MKTIAEIKAEFAAADMSSYPALYEIYKEDTRSGVQKLIAQIKDPAVLWQNYCTCHYRACKRASSHFINSA